MTELARVIHRSSAIFNTSVCVFLMGWGVVRAQTVEILAADQISRDPNITEAQRLIGHVKLGHQDAVLTCDSAWRFDDGKVEVFGEVVMRQPPSTTMNARYVPERFSRSPRTESYSPFPAASAYPQRSSRSRSFPPPRLQIRISVELELRTSPNFRSSFSVKLANFTELQNLF